MNFKELTIIFPTLKFILSRLKGAVLYLLFFVTYLCAGQSPGWIWAKSASGTDTDFGQSITTDVSGNVFATGYWIGTSITFGTTTLTNTIYASEHFFVVKYDPSGNILWAKSAGGTSGSAGRSISTDANGNVFVTGYFGGSTITFGTITLTFNGGNQDIFVVKYDPSGNVLWAKSEGGTSQDWGNSISTDANGNAYVTGFFMGSSVTFGTTTLTNSGSNDIFVVKYDPSGNILWAKSAGGTNSDLGNSLSTNASGDVIITGTFTSPSITFGTTTLTSGGTDDMFIVKYDPLGNVLWAKSAVGASSEKTYGISSDVNENTFVTGYFGSPTLNFGSITITNNTSSWDIFVVKYDPSGNVLWAKAVGGTGSDFGQSISTDVNGNAFVTGSYSSPSLTIGTTNLTNLGTNISNIFVAKYDPAGNVLWAKSAEGDCKATGVSNTPNGNVFITGYFRGTSINFGNNTLTNSGIPGGYDIFVAKLGSTTGIEQFHISDFTLQITPNPLSTTATLIITNSELISASPVFRNEFGITFTMYDVLGREVMQINNLLINNPITIQRDGLPNGLYFYEVSIEREILSSGKLVVQ